MTWSPKIAPNFVPKRLGPSVLERVIAALCYFTFGLVGLVYSLIKGTQNQSIFMQFNFLQSILLSLLAYVAGYLVMTIANLLSGTAGLFSHGVAEIVSSPFGILAMIVQGIGFVLMAYGAIWALLGKQPEMPVISKLVRRQMR